MPSTHQTNSHSHTHPHPCRDWFSFGKKLLLPALQAIGVDPAADTAAMPDEAVCKLLLVPHLPYLLVCGDVLSLWSSWDKPAAKQVWRLPLRRCISEHLEALRNRSDQCDIKEDLARRASMGAQGSSGAGLGWVADRFAFGRGARFGSVNVVDFALLHDEHDTRLGKLVVLVLYTPSTAPSTSASSSSLWLCTIDIETEDRKSQAAPQVQHCIYLSADVSSRTFSPDERPMQAGPRLYTLLPSWRLYFSWVHKGGRVVLGQIDARAVPDMSEALSASLDTTSAEDGGGGGGGGGAIANPPGITTLSTEYDHGDVVAINMTAASAGSVQIDGLVVLLQSSRGGKLVQCSPQMGTSTLNWGGRTHVPADASVAGDLVNDNVSVGALRDRLALTRLEDLLEPVAAASLAVVGRESWRNGPLGRGLAGRREGHAVLVERLHGAGITVAKGSERISAYVRAAHEQVCAAEHAWRRYQDFLEALSRGPEGFAKEAAAVGLDLMEETMREYVRAEGGFSDAERHAHSSAELFFSRPTELPSGLEYLVAALRTGFRQLQEHCRAFMASYCVALLLGAAMQGALDGAAEVDAIQLKTWGEGERPGTALALAVRVATSQCLEIVRAAAASEAQTQQWVRRGGDTADDASDRLLVQFFDLALLDYDAQERRGAGESNELEFEKRQHGAKKCVADSLMSLGLFRDCFFLSERHLVLEGVMRSAATFYTAPCRHLHPDMTARLRQLLRTKGATRARALLDASGQWDSSDTTKEGTYSMAEYAFLWIELHRPDLCELLLTLRDERPRIFEDEYLARAAGSDSSGPLVRRHYSWLAAVRDENLAVAAEHACVAAKDGRTRSVDNCVTLASVAKLAAYACQADQHDTAANAAKASYKKVECLQKSADRILLAAQMQRTYCPGMQEKLGEAEMIDSLLQPTGCSICGADLRCGDCRARILEVCEASLALLAAVLADSSDATAGAPNLTLELQQFVARTWHFACFSDVRIGELNAVLESGEAMAESEQAEAIRASIIFLLLQRAAESPAMAELIPKDAGRVVTWNDVLRAGEHRLAPRTEQKIKGWESLLDC